MQTNTPKETEGTAVSHLLVSSVFFGGIPFAVAVATIFFLQKTIIFIGIECKIEKTAYIYKVR